ncbi:MAG: DNA-binding protein [Nitriliruptor sp.]|nr:MAG: DNA-binding protein [Nitriliruptor sp.]
MPRSTIPPPPRLLTVAEAAGYLGTTTSLLYELVASHDIPSVRIGRAIRIPGDALNRLASRNTQGETEVCASDLARTDRLASDSREHLARSDHADRPISSPPYRRPTFDAVRIADRCHCGRQTSGHPRPNSREAPSPDTDLHPRATGPRVDAECREEARS